ncbi:hypothetical protein CYMTET_40380 [Cymbomonas tetramitiformis]|uniref:Uncharacterized protein n=1 Tax=Cymbomonas tetramitiformis TaxID=36881 RepID=A0AAE0F313_9CHLO|nr:hypothetical protein CYMTET_40380 [Cymbomonas tetramitiformis]
MNALIECLCSPSCSLFCSMISIFGILIMGMLGTLIGSGYGYVGEWGEKEKMISSAAQQDAANNCYTVAMIWTGFLGASMICCCANRTKPGQSSRRL